MTNILHFPAPATLSDEMIQQLADLRDELAPPRNFYSCPFCNASADDICDCYEDLIRWDRFD